MTITTTPSIKDGRLTVGGKAVPSGVPASIMISPASNINTRSAAFIGATSTTKTSRHVFTLGFLQFKIWWMIPRFGKCGSDVPVETQMLLSEVREDSALHDETFDSNAENTFYILLLPLLDGDFRTSLQGSSNNVLQFCVESGFRFGWCTWDAFYTAVNPLGIKEGLESLSSGGCPPRFLIIDDGWQDTVNEFLEDGKPLLGGRQYIRIWHVLVGYWGGVLPTSEALQKYNPKLVYPFQSPGNLANIRDIGIDGMEKYGVGIIDPSKICDFYNDLHSYLSNRGVDGVKVDVQNVIETLGYCYGGRVSLSRQYQLALEESIETNFKDNHLICCMSHSTEYIFNSKKGAVARAADDFMPTEETFQTLHVAKVAFNGLLLGEFVIPDWDMFHSKHLTAEFHSAARAVGGCGVYVSAKPGIHDFDVLKKLVLPDGSVRRARYAGRPTKDCLFKDPVIDGESLLKIWNLNKCSGVVGVFKCQGVGSWPCKEDTSTGPIPDSIQTSSLSGHVSPINVEFLEEVAGENWTGDCAVYAF